MQRSTFLLAGLGAAVTSSVPLRAVAESIAFAPNPAFARNVEITTTMTLARPGPSKAWIPLPSVESTWNRSLVDTWETNAATAVVRTDSASGARMLVLSWTAPDAQPAVTVYSRVATLDRAVDLRQPRRVVPLTSAERARYTAATRWIPTDGIVKATADKITAGATTDVDKARRIYDWIVANTYRNEATRGCGSGDVAGLLESGRLGGKCADLNGLMVGLARASGIPARDLFGIRVAPSRFGYKSLGANTASITSAQHCRAEVFLTDYGWTPTDPADVRKVMLEEPPGGLTASNPKVQAVAAGLFGSWEGNWIAYNAGADIRLPGSDAPALPFLMYPQAVNGGVACDCLDPAAVTYTITAA